MNIISTHVCNNYKYIVEWQQGLLVKWFPRFKIMPTPSATFCWYTQCIGTVQLLINDDATKFYFNHFHTDHYRLVGKVVKVLATEHCSGVMISAMASQITGVSIVWSTLWSGADQRKHQRSASLAFVKGIQRWQGNSPHKRLVTRKMVPFDNVIMSIHKYHSLFSQWWCFSKCFDFRTLSSWSHFVIPTSNLRRGENISKFSFQSSII